MKSLIILKGLVKSTKIGWVKSQGLDKFFLDIDSIRKMYSSPELILPDRGVLGRSFGDTVYKRFLEVFNIRLSKGCLVIIDAETESTNTFELLATIYGYTIFFVVQDTPKDYVENQRKYNIPYYGMKKKSTLEREVEEFKNLKFNDKIKISKVQDVIEYWNKKEKSFIHYVNPDDKILHVSDLHSNYELYKKLPKSKNYKLTVFHGDYIDGPEVGGSRKLMDQALFHPSLGVIWLEGNHELRLRRYLGHIIFKEAGKKDLAEFLKELIPPEFFEKTEPEFSNINPQAAMKYILAMNERLKMFTIIKTPTEQFICSHSGLIYKEQLDPRYVGNLIYCGRDMNRYDKAFSDNNAKLGIWSVHAHCKYNDSWEVRRFKNVINLDPPSENEVVYAEQQNKEWNICLLQRENLE